MILVTGGTGFVGRHLVGELVAQGYPVRVLVRDLQSARNILPPDVDLIKGDVTERPSLIAACKGTNAVIYLVAVIREKGEVTFEKINIEGTLNTVIAAEQAGVKRFIHLSALGASDNSHFRYTYSKWLGEEAVRQSGLNWTILRPSIIYGPGFNFFDRLQQAIELFPTPFVPVPGRGNTLFQPIAVEDVVRCIVTALKVPAMAGQVYEIGGPEHLKYVEMLELYMQAINIKRKKLPIPMPVMYIATRLMEKFLKDPPVTLDELKQLKTSNITDVEAVSRHFGFKPKALREGVKYVASAEN